MRASQELLRENGFLLSEPHTSAIASGDTGEAVYFNKLPYHFKFQRRHVPTLFRPRRNRPFTSPEYALKDTSNVETGDTIVAPFFPLALQAFPH
jgi:hypothetical protein